PAEPPATAGVDPAAVATAQRLVQQVATVVVGRPGAVRMAVACLAAGGHCLLEDVPGVAKTLLVRTVAQAAGMQFARVQFTPDLLPADITGGSVFNLRQQSFELRKGPVFTQVLLADELNRAPPKTQAALLEAMQEQQVTLEGQSHPLPRPFTVFATQNPIEQEGVYVLPEAELDRFLVRVAVGYPTPDEEERILARVESWKGRQPVVAPVADPQRVLAMQEAARSVFVHPDLKQYIVRIVNATRQDPRVLVGSSPRGSIALQAMAKAVAMLGGRSYAQDEHVKEVAQAVLAHRVLVRPEWASRGVTPHSVVQDALDQVPTPPVPRVGPR
ncbi:MAG TPA: MoxR family ATPase, partial [Candidatus Thermoplasmatota archaeon]|nr:MoxR family ATPase [Candidatus Thermoplasmatota archaeon]